MNNATAMLNLSNVLRNIINIGKLFISLPNKSEPIAPPPPENSKRESKAETASEIIKALFLKFFPKEASNKVPADNNMTEKETAALKIRKNIGICSYTVN